MKPGNPLELEIATPFRLSARVARGCLDPARRSRLRAFGGGDEKAAHLPGLPGRNRRGFEFRRDGEADGAVIVARQMIVA